MIKKADIILALAVIAVFGIFIGAFFIFSPFGSKAVVKQNGDVMAELPLDEDREIAILLEEQGFNFIKVEDGKVSVSSADCPDQICVNHVEISKVGETIVCLPHKLTVEIVK